MRANSLRFIAVAMLLAACADTAPPPVVVPQGEDRFLVDPRAGYSGSQPEEAQRRFETAWRHFLSGNRAEARRRVTELQTGHPDYLPASLLQAALELRERQPLRARDIVQRVLERQPDYTAARIYEAEIALAERQHGRSLELYRAIARRPDAPETAAERVRFLERTMFEELFTAAQAAPDDESVRLLREALTLNPGAVEARLLLARRLIGLRRFDEARVTLAPLTTTAEAERAEVQEMLAEIDAGQGRYREAIARYENLIRRAPEPRFSERLEVIKERWGAANMPPQYQAALQSEALTRADFAVLMYWTVSSVRFAQNLAAPMIATDIADVPGREEIIRAIAAGLYEVDPVTRRVNPYRTITPPGLSRLGGRLLLLRGAACAAGAPPERALQACGIADPAEGAAPDGLVSGRSARAMLQQIDRVLSR